MAITVAEKKHAVLGPSGWHTWGVCPGSVPLSDGIIDKSSDYADEGTAAHQLLEDCLNGGLDADDLLGRKYRVGSKDWEVTQDMADAVNAAINIIKDEMAGDDSAILQVEQSLPIGFMTGEEGAEGTGDIAIIKEQGTHLHILDYKHGQGVIVYASDYLAEEDRAAGHVPLPNGQLAMYALGWLQKHGIIYEDITKVTLGVMQPRKEHYSTYELPVEQLRNFEDEVREAAGRVELEKEKFFRSGTEELTLVPTEKGCKFCKAKARCPALRQVAVQAMSVGASDVSEFEDLSLPKQASAAIGRVAEVSSEKLAEAMRAASLMEEFIKAVRAEVERRLFAGEIVPGYKVVEGKKGNRAWSDEAEALKEMTKSGRLKMDEATTKKPISVTQAEKKLKSRPKIWEKIVPLITQSGGKPSVAPDDDPRPAISVVSDVAEFEDLEAETQALPAPSVLDDLMS